MRVNKKKVQKTRTSDCSGNCCRGKKYFKDLEVEKYEKANYAFTALLVLFGLRSYELNNCDTRS